MGSAKAVTTDASGRFTTEISGPGEYTAVVSGAAIVERRTMVTGPSVAPRTRFLMSGCPRAASCFVQGADPDDSTAHVSDSG